jgi:hypothetical protein
MKSIKLVVLQEFASSKRRNHSGELAAFVTLFHHRYYPRRDTDETCRREMGLLFSIQVPLTGSFIALIYK